MNGQDSVPTVAIYGASGHARVIADVLSRLTPKVVIEAFLDDRPELHGTTTLGLPVLGDPDIWLKESSPASVLLIVGIGDNRARELVSRKIVLAGFDFISAVHPSAHIGSEVKIGSGTVIMPNAVINTSAVIGDHVIVNTAATVDHDCVLEDFSHISPGVNLAGSVTVGHGAHVGIGASVVPGVRIGDWAMVGAGSTVTKDVPPHTTVVGTRAVPIRRRNAAQ